MDRIRALAKAATLVCECNYHGECSKCELERACTRERLLVMCDVIDAAKAYMWDEPVSHAKAKFDAALARLEEIR